MALAKGQESKRRTNCHHNALECNTKLVVADLQ
jgi:hypothetical protein